MTKRNAFLSVLDFCGLDAKALEDERSFESPGVSCPMSVAAVWLTMTRTRFSAFLDFCGLDAKTLEGVMTSAVPG